MEISVLSGSPSQRTIPEKVPGPAGWTSDCCLRSPAHHKLPFGRRADACVVAVTFSAQCLKNQVKVCGRRNAEPEVLDLEGNKFECLQTSVVHVKIDEIHQ